MTPPTHAARTASTRSRTRCSSGKPSHRISNIRNSAGGCKLLPSMRVLPEEIATAARFLLKAPALLRASPNPDRARAGLRQRLQDREKDFLALARQAIYGHAESPHLRLLAWAGCEYGDLERLV